MNNLAYFAHPIKTYHSRKEKEILLLLKSKNWIVINPSLFTLEARRLSNGKWLECASCKKQIMEVLFYPQVKRCDLFVYWNPYGSCGTNCELELAKKLVKRIYKYPYDFVL